MIDFDGKGADEKRAQLRRLLADKKTAAARASPLSFGQERLWLEDQLGPASPLYNIAGTVRFEGSLDVGALQRALEVITQRHEALRAVFKNVEGRPVQQLLPELRLPLNPVDLRALPPELRARELERLTQDEVSRPFDLVQGPLLRASLLRLGEAEHVLLLSLHHIVSDGWSQGVLVGELAALYEAFLEGRPSPLLPLPIQYSDFARWQRQKLRDGTLGALLGYWEKELSGAPGTLALPLDRVRPAVQRHRGARHAFVLDAALTSQVSALSAEAGVTPFMTLLAAWTTLLYRFSGQTDIVVGTPIANRNRTELEGLVGFFVNTLALRTQLSPVDTFSELLLRVRESTLGAFAHQDAPFEKVVERLAPTRDLSHSPVFQAMFVLQNAPNPPLEMRGLKLSLSAPDSGLSLFDLTLTLEAVEGRLEGSLEFDTDLFEPATADRLIRCYRRLLECALHAPGTALADLPLEPPEETQRQLTTWNDTPRDYGFTSLADAFAAQVDRTPEAPAVVFEGLAMTYRSLDARANQLAHHLRAQGVGPDVVVGLCMERSLELVVGILGVLKAGGAYLPLEPTHPVDRLAYMAQHARVRQVLTQQHLAIRDFGTGISVIALEEAAERLGVEPTTRPPVHVRPDNLAYVIYTSGSTGKPKGVMNTQGGTWNRLRWKQDAFPIGPADTVLQKTPFSFDVSVWEFLWPLFTGARLVVARPEGHRDPGYLAKLIRTERITTLHFVPSMLRAFLEEDLTGCHGIRQVLCSGEALPYDLQQRLFSRLPAALHNLYGPTEASIDVTWWACRREDARHVVPIGTPIANTQTYVLDGRLRPVPEGVVGQLFLGGVGLARGYLGRADLTAERFIPNPFGAPGTRLYATGDLVRTLSDGSLEFLGRNDHQVKVRGLRVELEEIEAQLTRLPGVRQGAVLAPASASGEPILVAYVVLEEHAELAVRAWQESLRQVLPGYMVPAVFLRLEAFPLTTSGKLDRGALPAPALFAALTEAPFEVPATATEERLAKLWAGLLKVERVGRHDDFFQRGGHSLLAVRMAAGVGSALEVELPLRDIFENSVLSALAARVDVLRQQDAAPLPPRRRVNREGMLPLSAAQARLWLVDQLEPAQRHAYNVPVGVRLRGALDAGLLERSFNLLIARHEALRTTIVENDGMPAQWIAPRLELVLEPEDLRVVPEAERSARVEALASAEAATPFDLHHGPLLRVRLLRTAALESVCLLTVHHIVTDGWSMGLLVQELAQAYGALREGRTPELGPLPFQQVDHAAWEQELFANGALDAQLAHWRTVLGGAPPVLELPTDHARPARLSGRGGRVSFQLAPELVRSLRAFSRSERATLFMTLLSGFGALLHRYAGRPEAILVGSPVSGRHRTETHGVMGLFVNTLVQRLELQGRPSFRELLRRTRATALQAQANPDVPFDRLVEVLKPARDASRSPLFQVLFDFHHAPPEQHALPGLTFEKFEPETGTSKFELSLELEEVDDHLEADFEFSLDLFEPATVEQLARHYAHLLREALAHPDLPLDALSALPPDEWWRLIVEPNRTARPWDLEVTLPALFERAVARHPEALAASCHGETLSYAQLNARANRVAHALRTHGVGPESVVGLLQERSLGYLVSVLGVLKSGGAFVPLDAGQPPSRLQGLLAQCGCRLVLTEPRHRALAVQLAAGVPVLTVEEAQALGRSEENVTGALHPRSLAYVIFTSGSTGTPKGALIEHRGMLNHLRAKVETLGMGTADVLAQTSTHTFDVSVWQLLAPLVSGGQVSIYQQESAWEPTALLAKLSTDGATLLETVPSHLTLLVEELESRPGAYDLSAMRWLFLNGEALLPQLCERWFRLYPSVPMVNSYGATECSDDTTQLPIRDPRPIRAKYHPIHGNLPNLTGYVLDAALAPCPFGVTGEMYIGGVGVGRGYLKDAARTAAVFLPNPFSAEPGERMYKSGDLVRAMRDGSIEFLGRLDQQVKVRGHRIEMGEIEATLARHPQVRECVVVAQDAGGTDKRLVGYVAHGTAAAPTPAELAAFLGEQLADYMVPSAFVVLSAMPLLPSGKIDRKSLPAPSAPGAEKVAAPLRTATERALAQVWSELLEAPDVGADSNFFELGGHSLLAIQTISRLRRTTGLELSVRDLFEGKTVAEVARRLDLGGGKKRGTSGVFSDHPLESVGAREHYELAATQLPEWFIHELEPTAPIFNVSFADVVFVGDLDVGAFVHAWQVLVARHDAFRTTFGNVNGQPVQRVLPELRLTREDIYVDCTQVPEALVDEEMRRLTSLYTGHVFDFERGPMFLLKLVALPHKRFFLIFHTHHIVWDELSTMTMSRELMELYNAFVEGRAPVLAKPELRYVDFAHWLNRAVAEGWLEDQRQYWLKTFKNPPAALELPTDFPRPVIQTFAGDQVERRIPAELRARLEAFLKLNHLTLNIFLMAVLDTLLHRLSGQTDFVVGTPFANRADEALEGVLGLFATALPIRCTLKPGETFRGLLHQVQEASIEAFDNHLYPSILAIQEINPATDLSRNRLFSVMYGLQNNKTRLFSETNFRGLELEFLDGVQDAIEQTAPFDLTWIFDFEREDLLVRVNFNKDLYVRSTAERFIAQFLLLAEQAITSPDLRLADYTLLGTSERAHVLESFNASGAPYPADASIHGLVEAQVDRTPEAPALASDQEVVTYRRLDEDANQWAHHLLALGFTAEDKVGLLLEPSLRLPVAVLAVLKAGGTYVPVNPDDPVERQGQILREAGVRLVLTDRARPEGLPGITVPVVSLAELAQVAQRQPKSRPAIAVHARQRAYILFTSGSTGVPKGIEIEHRGIVNLVHSTQARYGLSEKDTLLFITPLSFDASVLDLYWPLCTGALVAVPEPGELRSPTAIAERVRKQGVTVMQTVPIMLGELVEGTATGSVPPMPSLRLMLCGGAFLSRALRDRFIGMFRCRLANHYGPTEVTVDASQFDCAQHFVGSIVPLGKPIQNARLYVLDGQLSPVPIGVSGEVYVASPGLARGYLKDPARTARAFLPNPFGAPGERLYRTGDLGRYDSAGNVHFLGRADKQVKVRGHRVEIEEIESHLESHPAVAHAAVRVARGTKGGDGLTASVELRPGYSWIVEGAERYRLITLAQAPELKTGMDRTHAEAWPEYFVGDSTMRRYWPRLATEFPEFQFALLDEQDAMVAVGNAIPIQWDGTVEDLPSGWDDGLERGFLNAEQGVRANTFLILTGVVASNAQGRGLAMVVLKAFKTLAHALHYERVVVPVRPTGKTKHPELDFKTYCQTRRPDGALADDWLRTHERVGGRTLKVELQSQYIRAGLEDWERWSGQKFTKTGEYLLRDTLQPVRIDLDARCGEYYDPSVWVEHPAVAGSHYAWDYVAPQTLRDHLRSALPEYMVPQSIHLVSAMPLTSAGKLDERALTAMLGRVSHEGQHQAAQSTTQLRLVAVWRQVLGAEKVGVRDDFFALGGHSIRAAQMLLAVEQEFGEKVSLRDFYREPTILALERRVDRRRPPGATAAARTPTTPVLFQPGVGFGHAPGHHGEVFQGVTEVAPGQLKRCLVSLPCNILKTEAVFTPDDSGIIRVEPLWKVKAKRAAELALSALHGGHFGGKLELQSNIPVGWGLGSSTSDVVATLRAVAHAFQKTFSPQVLGDLAVKAEHASDSIMFEDRAVLFAHRAGVVVEDFIGQLPELDVLGFNTDATGDGVDTLSLVRARYSSWEIEAFRVLQGLLRRAVRTHDPRLLGRVATASAVISQRHLPKPHFERLLKITEAVGAVGLQVAHSGTVAGILFDAADPQREGKLLQARTQVLELGFGLLRRFRTGPG